MRNSILGALLQTTALLLSVSLQAQSSYAVANIPSELLQKANIVVRLDETIFTIQPDGQAVMEETYVATILNKEGSDAAMSGGQEDRFMKIKMLKGKIYDAQGKLVSSSKDADIQVYGGAPEYEFTDNKIKYLHLLHPQYPYTVEFRKKTVMKEFMGIPSVTIQSLGTAVEHWKCTFVAPFDYRFKWKVQGTEPSLKESTSGSNSVWEWELHRQPAQALEPNTPYFNDVFAQIMFAPETIHYDGKQGDFKNWKGIGTFFYELNNGRESLPAATLAKVQELTAGKTAKEKIAAVYRITQDNCRYVSIQLGIGGWQTFEAEFVDQKKYGDCKALSNYTQALLKAAGIEAWEASIYAGSEGAPDIDETFPDPYFNHLILYVPAEDCWLECTSKTHPAGYLGSFTADRPAMLYTPEGGKLVRTPALTAADNFEKSHTKIELLENGNAQVSYQGNFGGARHEVYRHFALEDTREEFEKYFAKNAPYNIARLAKMQLSAGRATPEAQLEYELEAAKISSLSGKRIFVPLTKTSPFKLTLPANERRTLELQLKETYCLQDTFRFFLPVGFEPENIPEGQKIASEFGSYELSVETQPGQITVFRKVEVLPVRVPAARYAEVRQFFLDTAKADAAQMVLVKKQ